jgi:hypothetical protein
MERGFLDTGLAMHYGSIQELYLCFAMIIICVKLHALVNATKSPNW